MADNTTSNVSFASGKRFISSIRHQGLSTEDAIKELVDNSIDAGAENIHINAWKDEGGVNIMVQDDGHGMDRDSLQRSVAFGETDNYSDLSRIGKFGFGLPSAITSRTKTAEVYSKQKGGRPQRMIVDLNALEEDPRMLLPVPDEHDPRSEYGTRVEDHSSGTIVVLKACDRLDVKKPETIREHLVDDLSETYREFIASGKRIFVNGAPLAFIDPLMQMGGHKYAAELAMGLKETEKTSDTGYSKVMELDPIEIEYKDEDGKKGFGYLKVLLALLPQKDIDRTGGAKKYGLSVKTSGFYVVRNKRQIARGVKLPGVFEPHNRFNYVRGQISFEPCLDEECGVEFNKSRFTLSTSIKTKLANQVKPLVRQLVKESKVISDELNDQKEKDTGIAEMIAKDTPYRNPREIREATNDDIKRAIVNEMEKIDGNTGLDDEEKEARKERIRVALEGGLPFTIDTVRNKQGPIYTWEYTGRTTKVVLNTEHPFYQYYWVPTQEDPYVRTLLKILLFTLVKGEQLQDEQSDQGGDMTFDELHSHWSTMLRKFLNSDKFINFYREHGPELEESEASDGAAN